MKINRLTVDGGIMEGLDFEPSEMETVTKLLSMLHANVNYTRVGPPLIKQTNEYAPEKESP